MPRVFRLLVLAALLGSLLAGVSGVEPVRAYPGSHVNLTGHGWGHGRGMGQWGALGYALNYGRSYTEILDHFYGNTVTSDIGDPTMTVRLLRMDGRETIVVQENGNGTVNGAPAGRVAMRAQLLSTGKFQVYVGDGCGGPWTKRGTPVDNPVVFGTVGQTDSHTTMLQLCEVGAIHWYRGELLAVNASGAKRTVNRLNTEAYLRGVVPRESPDSWGSLGGGAGMHALRAQAVAARSYAISENRYGYAKTCDTESCQVYRGRAVQDSAGFRSLEGPNANRAIAETAGDVRRFKSTNAVARTEFSSSTGGYTAGDKFPAVEDLGDSISPNHVWKASVPVSAIQAAYPEIGTLVTVSITKRNGLGDWGGRVLELVLRGSKGSKTLTGNTFRSKFGLKSDWFNLCDASGGVDGYWVAAPDGGVFAFGKAEFFGSMGGIRLNRPIVGMASNPDSKGYWLVASDGGIFSFGSARFHGSTGDIRLNQPVVGMAPTKDGGGYWLVASDGGIFAFGNATFHGSMGGTRLNRPVVGMAATPSGNGYWLVASDGGIFAFGDATFHGSTGDLRLNQPVTAMAATTNGGGYWMIGRDGGIFAFGNAPFYGSLPGLRQPGPAEAIRGTFTNGGYAMATSDGRVFTFGDAPFCGDVASAVPGYRGGVEGFELRRAT